MKASTRAGTIEVVSSREDPLHAIGNSGRRPASLAAALMVLAAILLFGCSNGEGRTEGPANTIEDAVSAYLAMAQLDQRIYVLTQPRDCDRVRDVSSAVGKICIDYGRSQIGSSSALLRVGIYGTEGTWLLELSLDSRVWMVGRARYIGN